MVRGFRSRRQQDLMRILIFNTTINTMNYHCIASLLIMLLAFSPSQQEVITVDSTSGNDTLCTQNNSYPCKTLHTALKAVRNDTIVQIHNGTYPHNTTTTLTYSNVNITGSGSDVTIVECDSNGTGFGFINVTNIHISGLTLLGCGALRNSTTLRADSNVTLPFRAALYYLNIRNVTIDDVVVSNSIGMGVAMYDVTGHVNVSNSIFRNNSVPSHESTLYPGGGGFSVQFTYCKPGLVDDCGPSNNSNATYLFDNCIFEQNNATSTNNIKYVNVAFGLGNEQFGRGGGLSVFFQGRAKGNRIIVSGSKFIGNDAIWGGGFHSDFLDYSSDNDLIINNSAFIDNHCGYEQSVYAIGTGGGGIRIALHFYNQSLGYNNLIEILHCDFENNSAYYGGGVSFSTTRERNVLDPTNTILFMECTWTTNMARTGSGVDLNVHTLPTGVVSAAYFRNCKFVRNNNYYLNATIFLLGIGSLYSDLVPIDFDGTCYFTSNTDSAIAGTALQLSILKGSTMIFENNTGHHGGAIALLGNSYLLVYNRTLLKFSGNRAKSKGGAIYSLSPSERDFVSTKKCFVYYHDPNVSPYDWNTSFVFRDNYATVGTSIFVTTLLPCAWNGLPGQVNISDSRVLDVLYWNGTFNYSGNLTDEIGTEPLNVEENTLKDSNNLVVILPGQLYNLNINPTNDRSDNSTAVFLVQTNNTSAVSVDTSSVYASRGIVQLRGQPNTTFSLELQTVGVRPLSVIFSAKLDSRCPPGYYIDGMGSEGVCRCSSYNTKKGYRGIAKCDDRENELVAYLRPQVWAGYDNTINGITLFTGDCPENYCFTNGTILIPLPSNSSVESLDRLLCGAKHRTGRLCGACRSDHYVLINSPTYDCGRCDDILSKHGIWFIILFKYVPMTIFLCVIMFFNISLVHGPLNAFILFSQFIFAMDLYAGGIIDSPSSGKSVANFLIKSYEFLYGIWNLNFIEILIDPFCSLKYRSALPILALEYVSASYPILLLLLFFVVLPWTFSRLVTSQFACVQNCAHGLRIKCIRFRSGWSVQNTIIHGLITFLVLSYVKFTAVSWKILSFGIVYGPGGEDSDAVVTVAWLDGTKSYLDEVHGKYAAGAFVVFFFFVFLAPLFLLSHPYLPRLLTILHLENKWIVQKLLLTPLGRAVPFFDVVQSCFKDEYRFFAAFYFAYRVIAYAIFSFSTTVQIHYLWQIGFYTAILLLHSFCQPYKKRWHNMVDSFIFSLLIVINTISFYRYYGFVSALTTSVKSFWIQLFLIYCPLIYFVIYVLQHWIKWCRPRVKKIITFIRQLSGYQVLDIPSETDTVENLPARLYDDDSQSKELDNSTKWINVKSEEDAVNSDHGCPPTIQSYGSTS